jgi:hypothetical protein
MEAKLRALYAYDCQMVLTLDEFLSEARLLGLAPEGIDPTVYEPWIEMAMRAVHGELGAQAGVTYAEAFRYECVEVPGFLKL